MPNTVENQRVVVIHREKPEQNFLQIKNEHWMEVNKKFTPYGLQLYLYLAKNKDNYSLALSPQAAENEAGIKRTTFHKYIDLFIAEGYLVPKNGNTYDFYETPHKQVEKNMESPPCGKSAEPQQEQQNLPHKSRSSSNGSNFPQSNKEIDIIDNKDTIYNEHIETTIQQQEERTNIAEKPAWEFNF